VTIIQRLLRKEETVVIHGNERKPEEWHTSPEQVVMYQKQDMK
jgi:hypothetical protein